MVAGDTMKNSSYMFKIKIQFFWSRARRSAHKLHVCDISIGEVAASQFIVKGYAYSARYGNKNISENMAKH